jgi:hypothetical protein
MVRARASVSLVEVIHGNADTSLGVPARTTEVSSMNRTG